MLKYKNVVIVLLFILVIGIIIACIFGLTKKDKKQLDNILEHDSDNVYVLQKDNIYEYVSTVGKLDCNDKDQIYTNSEKVVEKIFVKEGDIINEGDILFSYSKDDLINKKNELEDQYNKTKEKSDYQHQINISNLEGAINELDILEEKAKESNNNIQVKKDEAYYNYNNLSNECISLEKKISDSIDENEILNLKKQYEILLEKVSEAKNEISSYDALLEKNNELYESEISKCNKNIKDFQDIIDREKFDDTVDNLSKELQKLNDDLMCTEEKASISGIISKVKINTGKNIDGSYIEISGGKNLVANVNINADDIEQIKKGMEAEVRIGKSELKKSAEVIEISRIPNENNSTYPVILKLEADYSPNDIFLQIPVTAKIYTNMKKDVLVAPVEFVSSESNGNYTVLCQRNIDGTIMLKKIGVELGIKSRDTIELISNELNVGDKLVVPR